MTAVGATFGVEEEYHLVDPGTFALAARPALSERVLAAAEGSHLKPEMLTSQLEAVTDVLASLDELAAALGDIRAEAAAVAAEVDAVLLATSTHPFAPIAEIDVMKRPRYDVLTERFGVLVRQLNLVGCHVHVSVPDLDTAVRVTSASRPYLPLLSALTSSSPYHEGADTGFDSFRLAELAVWPQGGPPPQLRSGEEYLATVDRLVALGLVDDASAVLWDVRPSARYPTVEFRIGDMCPDRLHAVAYTGIVRSLTRVLASRGAAGPQIGEAELRAARWQAARYGLSGQLWSPAHRRSLPAGQVVTELLDELRPDLEEHGEWQLVSQLVSGLLDRGNSASWQRRRFESGGDMRALAAAAVALTAE